MRFSLHPYAHYTMFNLSLHVNPNRGLYLSTVEQNHQSYRACYVKLAKIICNHELVIRPRQ